MTTILKKQRLVETFPAHRVYERAAHDVVVYDWSNDEQHPQSTWFHDVVDITAKDLLKFENGIAQACSIVSCAIEDNECPIKAVEECKNKMHCYPCEGHKLHWISTQSVCLTDTKQKQKEVILVRIGMRVRFEGLFATIESAPNGNLCFSPIKKPKRGKWIQGM
tara:strand:+ start:1399 stop:1890 length:492 start_codon:yes stop_codon:yes gene_type:complete